MPENNSEIVPPKPAPPSSSGSATAKKINKQSSKISHYGWVVREFIHKWNHIIPAITLVVSIITLVVLYKNLIFFQNQIILIQKQLSLTQNQIELTQILNQPFCAVKELRAVKDPDESTKRTKKGKDFVEVVKITSVIKNYGNYVSKKTTLSWSDAIFTIIEKNKIDITKWEAIPKSKSNTVMAVLPQQEIEVFMRYIDKKDFDNMVEGYKTALVVKLTVDYRDMDNKAQQYSCFYAITRLLTDDRGVYEVSLKESKLDEISADGKR
ncbi:MAG: hypothetical protein KKD92_00690 [Proteobacteria bacterium]|nr:hypothetical protein [Pseudomonadota bacterium]